MVAVCLKGYDNVWGRYSKDSLFQVGLAHWEVIHSNTWEGNEKVP